MWCPRCANDKTKVQKTVKGTNTQRFRKCSICNYTFTSIELIKNDRYLDEYAKSTIWSEMEDEDLRRIGIDL